MKVIIDIPEDMFEWFKNGEIIDEYDKSALKQVFQNGTLLEDVIAEIADIPAFNYDTHKVRTRALEILDNIGEADFPQSIQDRETDMREPKGEKIRCNICKNNDDELSGECYECLKGIFDHYEPQESQD